MANPNFGSFNRAGAVADQAAFDVGLRAHMVRVYNYMASGLALSGIVAVALFNVPELASLFFQVEGGFVVGLNTLAHVPTMLTALRYRAAACEGCSVPATCVKGLPQSQYDARKVM